MWIEYDTITWADVEAFGLVAGRDYCGRYDCAASAVARNLARLGLRADDEETEKNLFTPYCATRICVCR